MAVVAIRDNGRILVHEDEVEEVTEDVDTQTPVKFMETEESVERCVSLTGI